MIDHRELLRRSAGGGIVAVDAGGRAIDAPSDDLPVPTLLVAPVSDAVKRRDGDMVIEDIDRDLLWAVRAAVVDHVVVESLPDGSFTMVELIQQVKAAGHVWETTPL